MPDLSFGDNLRPSQVTPKLREELAEWERRKRKQLVLAPSIFMLVASLVLFATVPYEARGFTPWARIFGSQMGILAMFVAAIFFIFSRRIRFLRDAEVTTAAVLDKETTTLWALGGSQQGSWATPSARNIREALNMEDDGTEEEAPHLVKVRLRFVPGLPNEHLDWPALRDEAPHCEVTKRLRGGGWGTFMGDLKQGSLVTLLYWPENPMRCKIVRRFASHERLCEQ